MMIRPAAGDVLDVYSTGGGGYGYPWLRPVENVVADVADGLLSVEKARRSYRVVVDPETLDVDVESTKRMREAAGPGVTA
jgi:N-methylhydantoinase B